jgi:hypothetical protein
MPSIREVARAKRLLLPTDIGLRLQLDFLSADHDEYSSADG